MQTFLPRPSFPESAEILDDKRLCKQITECKQIALAISDPPYGWQHHPAVRMWRGSYTPLIHYGCVMYIEWMGRYDVKERGGKRDHKAGDWLLEQKQFMIRIQYDHAPPSWLGDPKFHASHRAALLRKGLEDTTFSLYHDDVDTPSKKSEWIPEHYTLIWNRYGMPAIESTHYGQFGWTEQPAVPDEKGRLPYVWPA